VAEGSVNPRRGPAYADADRIREAKIKRKEETYSEL
jgi:hypothetical protein